MMHVRTKLLASFLELQCKVRNYNMLAISSGKTYYAIILDRCSEAPIMLAASVI